MVWSYPRRSECGSCHVEASGASLSLEAAQLDDAQLRGILSGGYVDRRVSTVDALRGSRRPALVDPHGDAARTVDQEVGKTRRQARGLLPLAIIGVLEVDRVLLDIGEEAHGGMVHPHFGVAHGGGGIIVDGP